MVDIVIVRYGLPEIEDKCIQRVKDNTTYPYKLTVIDNFLNKESLSVIWNRCIEQTDCDFLCFLNSDAFVYYGWLEEMMSAFDDSKVAGVGPSGNGIGGIQRSIDTYETALKCKGKYQEVQYISGCCQLIRKDLPFRYPEEVPFYGNDEAWDVLARRNGYKLIWAKGAYLDHIGEASSKKQGTRDKLRAEGLELYLKWLVPEIPILFITYNRIAYTKQSLYSLTNSDAGNIWIVDNGSSDGTREWLKTYKHEKVNRIIFNDKNLAVSGTMNQFFEETKNEEFVAKVDNDTIVKPNWLTNLTRKSLQTKIDIIQTKHAVWNDQYATFDDWMKHLKQHPGDPSLYYNDFVGGSAIVVRRWAIKIPIEEKKWVLGGWTEYQRKHPELKKAFCSSEEVVLLDMLKDNVPVHADYPEYYKKTGRYEKTVKVAVRGVEDSFHKIENMIGKRFAFTRFGDGELLMFTYYKGRKDNQIRTPELQKELIESFTIKDRDYLIGNIAGMPKEPKASSGLFEPFRNDEELKLITRKYYDSNKIFYSPIIFHYLYYFERTMFDAFMHNIFKHKVAFIGGEHLKKMNKEYPFNASVFIPKANAYETLDARMKEIEKVAIENDIILLACGANANVLQKRIWQSGINTGTIDIGSVANAICGVNNCNHTWIKKLEANK
jgi:GT2 family glycosyltransferase